MLTAEGCRQRRERYGKSWCRRRKSDHLFLSDSNPPRLFRELLVDPMSRRAGFPGYLVIRKDGHAKLLHEVHPKSAEFAHAEEIRSIVWYDGQSPAHGPRSLAS